MKQFKDTVAIKDIEIAKLQSDNETLKSELLKIKNRYKGIRQILDQAELKEKVEILIEVEKLRKVRMLKIIISRTGNIMIPCHAYPTNHLFVVKWRFL